MKMESDAKVRQILRQGLLNTPLRLMSSILILLVLITGKCSASCYFSLELQGTFVTQGAVAGNEVQYSNIVINEDSIPIWGVCHKRIDNNIILMMSSDETTCYRCFNVKLLSRNILRVATTDPDFISKCFTNEEKAIASCPSEKVLMEPQHFTSIILYKHSELDDTPIQRAYCPINGRYKLQYNNDDGTEDTMECKTINSELDNCPSGSALNIRFRMCSFEDHDVTFECLGHWEGHNGQKFLALMNTNVKNDRIGHKYRCAIYSERPNGMMIISFSKDSTCTGIRTPLDTKEGERHRLMEVLTLYPVEQKVWPLVNGCEFPDNIQGNWEHMTITKNIIVYHDQTSFKSYTMKCDRAIGDYYLVFSRTQCGEETYQCIDIKYRSTNIIEFQISSKKSADSDETLCSDTNFNNNTWLTQGRLDQNYVYSPCPVSGRFVSEIPDASNLCAKLTSECSSEDLMYYEVSSCDTGEVYEERKYRCLGQWEENDFVYTYTKRIDVGTYECFVGARTSNEQVYIREAGEHCQRDVDPNRYGMQLNQIDYCQPISTTENSPPPSHSSIADPNTVPANKTTDTRSVVDNKNNLTTPVAPISTTPASVKINDGDSVDINNILFFMAILLLFISNN